MTRPRPPLRCAGWRCPLRPRGFWGDGCACAEGLQRADELARQRAMAGEARAADPAHPIPAIRQSCAACGLDFTARRATEYCQKCVGEQWRRTRRRTA